MKSKPLRGVQDIHTMSERISQADNPQRKYLALAMLELEKARRNKEKFSARQRVAGIDRRITEIEGEQATLLAEAEAALGTSHPPHATDDPADSPDSGFHLTY
jgi:uncharacterized protein YhaN